MITKTVANSAGLDRTKWQVRGTSVNRITGKGTIVLQGAKDQTEYDANNFDDETLTQVEDISSDSNITKSWEENAAVASGAVLDGGTIS